MRKIPLLAGLFATASEIPENNGLDGWGGRDRTSEWGNQNPAASSAISTRVLKIGRFFTCGISTG